MSNPDPYKFKHTIVIDSYKTTDREGFYATEGGALNGNYTDFEVGMIIANDLGHQGWTYGEDFYFEDAGCSEVVFSVRDKKIATYLATKYDQPENPVFGTEFG